MDQSMMKGKHVVDVVKSLRELGSLGSACLIHHVVVFLISYKPFIPQSISASLLPDYHHTLAMLGH